MISVFLHLLTDQYVHACFKISLRLPDDNILLFMKNLNDQNPK